MATINGEFRIGMIIRIIRHHRLDLAPSLVRFKKRYRIGTAWQSSPNTQAQLSIILDTQTHTHILMHMYLYTPQDKLKWV